MKAFLTGVSALFCLNLFASFIGPTAPSCRVTGHAISHTNAKIQQTC